MVSYIFCEKCGKVIDEFEKECFWCKEKKEKDSEKINIENFYRNQNIDDDFDETFYGKEYPATLNFYQPHCSLSGIDDRHRLFYHYKIYGNTNYKNLLEKNYNIFVPKISKRKLFNKLAIVTSFFNPCEYDNIVGNYRKFSAEIKRYANLFPIELSFNNNFIIDDENVIRIHGTKNNMLWQKEALLNIAISKLPKEYTDVAWIDCDIIFENEDWIHQSYDALNNYKIVQLFSNAYKLDLNNNKATCSSLVSSFPNGEAGFAWAARRDVIEEVQLLDNQIFGGADFIMASAFLNKPSIIKNVKTYVNNEITTQWIEKATRIIDGSVGCIDSKIIHLYHGNEHNRSYTRQKYRKNLVESIDISKDVEKNNNIWTISEKHNEKIYKYFLNRQEDDNIHIQDFLKKTFDSYEECIDFYLKYICDNLMTTSPDMILQVKDKLLDGIKKYAQQHSTVYKENSIDSIFTRDLLSNKNSWICKNIPKNRIMNHYTSGSTTGEPFGYYNDSKYFDTIQINSEFDLILKEYDLYNKPLTILNLFKHQNNNPKPKKFFLKTKNYSNSRFHTYGANESTTYFVNWDNYMENPDDWHDQLLSMLQEVEFDIVLGSGPVFNILCRHIKKKNFKKHFAQLLSHTTEFPRIRDFQFLKDNGNITYYCDHMRCYDGGANFFTCKYNTYHLNDNLSWATQGPDNKLISTDYINMVAPFINYWNGDLCEIKDEYQFCKCGRYYRPFRMLENRPFALKGPTKLINIKKQISILAFKNKINQVQFDNLNVNLYVNKKLEDDEINILQDILKDYKIKIYE